MTGTAIVLVLPMSVLQSTRADIFAMSTKYKTGVHSALMRKATGAFYLRIG